MTGIVSSVLGLFFLGRRQRSRFLLAKQGHMCPNLSLGHYTIALDNGAAHLRAMVAMLSGRSAGWP